MTTEVKRLIRVRVEKGATFKRDGFGKKRQLSDSWRKPRGQHNKQREQKKAKGALPKPGFGSPIAVRGMHPSGFFEVMVFSEKDLEGLNPKLQAVRIGGTVGERKRIALQEKAGSAGLKVLNARVVKAPTKAKKPTAPEKDAGKTKKDEKKPLKSKISDALAPKKDAKKAKPAPAAEKKEAPVKAAKKSVAPKAEKPSEKPAEKIKAKTPVKPVNKPEKPAAQKPKESASSKPKGESAAKPISKKKSESGVKKNE
jgi:large subunit ribosomal protein L32e